MPSSNYKKLVDTCELLKDVRENDELEAKKLKQVIYGILFSSDPCIICFAQDICTWDETESDRCKEAVRRIVAKDVEKRSEKLVDFRSLGFSDDDVHDIKKVAKTEVLQNEHERKA